MSNIVGLFHPWEREPERGGWLIGVEVGGWRRERAARGCNGGRSTDPSASLHPRLSATLIFLHGPRSIIPRHIRPLSSPFPPASSASETELLYPPHFANAAGEQGAAFRPLRHPYRLALLIALSKFITEALVRGLPEFRYWTAVRRYVDTARPLYTKVSPSSHSRNVPFCWRNAP